MTPRPISQYLARFGAQDRREPEADAACEPPERAERADSMIEDATLAPRLAREEGWSEGYAEGFAAASRERDEAHQSASLAFEDRLASERARWVEKEGGDLGAKLDAALAAIEARIGASVARILRPYLAKLARAMVVDELAESVSLILRGPDRRIIEISGPEDLLDSLRAKLASSTGPVIWTPASSVDVKVVADQAIIESRIEAWIQRIDASPK